MIGRIKEIYLKATRKTIDLEGIEDINECFEELWVAEESDDISISKKLSDKDYIIYQAWRQRHQLRLYAKHKPNTGIFSGSADRKDMLIFHGGCQGCETQREEGLNACMGCIYFKCDWDKPNLSTGENRVQYTIDYATGFQEWSWKEGGIYSGTIFDPKRDHEMEMGYNEFEILGKGLFKTFRV